MESKYKIYIYGIGDSNNASYIYLPINPEKIKITFASSVETINILGLGERLLVKDRKLQSISWSAFLPPSDGIIESVVEDSSYVADPDSTTKSFKEAINNQTTCYLLINKVDMDGVESVYIERLPVIIEEFDTEEEGGLVNYIPYTITLRENPSGATSTTQVVAMNTVVSSGTTTNTNTKTNLSLVNLITQEGKSKWAIGDTVYVTANSSLSDIKEKTSTYKKLYVYKKDNNAYKAYNDVSLYNYEGVIEDKVSTTNIMNANTYTTYTKTNVTAPTTLYKIKFNSPIKKYQSNATSINPLTMIVNTAFKGLKSEYTGTNQIRYYEEIETAWCPEECLSSKRAFSGGKGGS